MLALVQRYLDHCQPARSYLLEMPKTGTVLLLLPEINDFFAKSTMTLALHFTLFSDGAKTAHFLLRLYAVLIQRFANTTCRLFF